MRLSLLVLAALVACGTDTGEPCADVRPLLDRSAVVASFRVGEEPWLIQAQPLPPRCASVATVTGHYITVSTLTDDPPRAVALHELGHALGILEHVSAEDAAMFRRVGAETLAPADLDACMRVGACGPPPSPFLAGWHRAAGEWNAVTVPALRIRFDH